MNTYINKRTGAVVVTESTVTGDAWQLVKPEPQRPNERPKARQRTKESERV